MTSSDPRTALDTLRPQGFGGKASRVRDPLVEPLWVGIRALAAIDGPTATLTDERGEAIDGLERIAIALGAANLTSGLIIDGFVTKQAIHDAGGIYAGTTDMPSVGRLIGQSMVGVRRNRAEEAAKAIEEARAAKIFGPNDQVSYVAIDLLWLDGESILDAPLLERRRLLESVLGESDVIRRGLYVRPPIETWAGSWRAQGFTGLTFKAANSRYLPGTSSRDWATSPMPRR